MASSVITGSTSENGDVFALELAQSSQSGNSVQSIWQMNERYSRVASSEVRGVSLPRDVTFEAGGRSLGNCNLASAKGEPPLARMFVRRGTNATLKY